MLVQARGDAATAWLGIAAVSLAIGRAGLRDLALPGVLARALGLRPDQGAEGDRGRNGDQNAAVHAYSPGAALQWHDGRSIRRGRRAHPSAVSLLRTGAEVFGARHRITPTSGDALARRARHGTHP